MKQPPQSAKSVLETLKLAYPEMPVALQKAARHIIDNPREVGVVSMRSLAVTLSIHPNAFVRLAAGPCCGPFAGMPHPHATVFSIQRGGHQPVGNLDGPAGG